MEFAKNIYIFLILVCISIPSFANTKVLIYADEGYEPYSYSKAGNPTGIYYEILNNAFSKMKGYDIIIETLPWKRGLQEIESGKAFAIYPPYYRPLERPWMGYSEKILDEKYTLFCKAKKEILAKKKWPEDYKGLSITKNSGFALPPLIMDAEKKGFITIHEAKETQQNLRMVIANHADCYVNDDLGITIELEQMRKMGAYLPRKPEDKILKIMDLSNEAGYIGYLKNDKGKYPFRDDFFKQFNEIISKMKKSGEIDEIKEKFIKLILNQ